MTRRPARDRQLTIRCSPDEVDRIKRLAEHHGISKSELLRMLIKKWHDRLEGPS
jgi:predicted DNA binding CopG/RHH family protein